MILICYDGSDDAKAAIQHAGKLMRGHPATVCTVWEPYTEMIAHTTGGLGPTGDFGDIDKIDHASRYLARQRAEEGAALAREAGIDARDREVERHGTVAGSILREADCVHADAIVMGSRGRGPVTSALLGSVSHGVMQHTDRPVLVVPSPTVAQRHHQALCGDREDVPTIGITPR